MKRAVIFILILSTAAALFAIAWQLQEARDELREARNENDTLFWAMVKTSVQTGREKQEISELKTKVDALAAGNK